MYTFTKKNVEMNCLPHPRPVILGLPRWFSLADGKLDVMQVEWGVVRRIYRHSQPPH